MENDKNGEVYSKVVRAGKRTYFFDVKATKGNDLYITLTESKKTFNDDGRDNYQKHKIFLYKEDFEKFREGLDDVLLKIESLKNSGDFESEGTENDENTESVQAYSNISFDDL
jgi:flagellar basal body L-ring protein FlgH